MNAAVILGQYATALSEWCRARSRLITVVLAGTLALLTGASLSWAWWWTVATTLAFIALVLIARSLFRAIASLLTALGMVGGALWLCTHIWPDALMMLHVSTMGTAVLMAVVAFICAGFWRAADEEGSYSLCEALGAIVGIAFAARMLVSIDTQQNLLRFLVHVEDNAAWVSITRDVATARFADADLQGSLGPSIPLALGVLSRFQSEGIPMYNATFAAYALAIFALPIIVAGLFGGRLALPRIAVAALFLLVLTWAYRVPFLLFASYGHLSAMWAFLALLALGSIWLRVQRSLAGFALVTGLSLLVGTLWFPIAGLAIISVWCAAIFAWPGIGRGGRITAGLAAIASTYILASQVPLSLAPGGGAADSVVTLYNAQGGTASLDPIIVAVMLGGVVALGWIASGRVDAVSRAWAVALICTLFVGCIFGGAYALRLTVGYGPTKVLFIVGMVVSVVLFAALARVEIPRPKAILSVLGVLAMASLIYGGLPDLLSRNWPGDPEPPSWLMPLERVVDSVGVTSAEPIACVSSGKWPAYLCTRWAAALTGGDDQQFLEYRMAIAGDQDPASVVDRAAVSGALARSAIIALEWPLPVARWADVMVRDASRVFGPDGKLLKGPQGSIGAS